MSAATSPISLTSYRDKTVCLLGLGSSGLSCARALKRGGALVCAWDDLPDARDKASAEGVAVQDLSGDEPIRDSSCLVVAPGVPLSHEVVRNAHFWNKPVVGDIELLWQTCPKARITGVTGTNGKSTTTALLGHLYRACGRRVQVGGNLGLPVLSFEAMRDEGEGADIVLELSSFQLDLVDKAHFSIGVLLNIAADHLDRYDSFSSYIAAKMRVARNSSAEDLVVCGIDDAHAQRIFLALQKAGLRVVPVSGFHACPGGVWVEGGRLYDDSEQTCKDYAVPFCAHLQGIHFGQNIAAAYAAARAAGMIPERIVAALADFDGLPHRMRETGTLAGVRYVDDSKATNPHAALHALASYTDSRIFWLAGGRLKGEMRPMFEELLSFVSEQDCVDSGYFFGESGQALSAHFEGCFPSSSFEELHQAFAAAAARARAAAVAGSPAVVLLSPACSSYDHFANYAERGEHFSNLVSALEGTKAEAS